MQPVLIFRHSPTEGPGYFATYLDTRRIPWRVVKIDAGEVVPDDPREASALVFMGGPMSVNDDLPWINPVLALIRRAVDLDVPVLGHCLGGQLIARALGAEVKRNPVKEIGWGTMTVEANDVARAWFGELREFLSFHWHGETFGIPPGATRLAASPYCANQAFASGRHLALQCHVEMTPALIRAWGADWEKELVAKAGPSVQTPAQMEEDLERRVAALNAVGRRLYDRWIEGVRTPA